MKEQHLQFLSVWLIRSEQKHAKRFKQLMLVQVSGGNAKQDKLNILKFLLRYILLWQALKNLHFHGWYQGYPYQGLALLTGVVGVKPNFYINSPRRNSYFPERFQLGIVSGLFLQKGKLSSEPSLDGSNKTMAQRLTDCSVTFLTSRDQDFWKIVI